MIETSQNTPIFNLYAISPIINALFHREYSTYPNSQENCSFDFNWGYILNVGIDYDSHAITQQCIIVPSEIEHQWWSVSKLKLMRFLISTFSKRRRCAGQLLWLIFITRLERRTGKAFLVHWEKALFALI